MMARSTARSICSTVTPSSPPFAFTKHRLDIQQLRSRTSVVLVDISGLHNPCIALL